MSPNRSYPLRLGVAEIDITPTKPVSMIGYIRPDPSQGMYHPLSAKALYLTDGATEAILLCADLCLFSSDVTTRFRKAMARAASVPPGNIILSASHTHTGPRISDTIIDETGSADPGYVATLATRLAAVAREAKLKARAGRVEFSRVRSRLGVNRRLVIDGQVHLNPNPEGAHDRAVDTRWFIGRDGRLVATLTTYGCHATVLSGQLLGGDYPGYFKDRMEARTGAPALWSAGCGANVRPAILRDDLTFGEGTLEDARAMGFAHADEVLAGRRGAFSVESAALRISRRWAWLPFQKPWTLRELKDVMSPRVVEQFGAKLASIHAKACRRRVARCETQVLSLNPAHHLVYWGGEICTEVGLGLKDLCPGQIVTPHGYANSMVGYVPAENMFPQGGYEVLRSGFYFGMPAPFVPNVQERLWHAALSLIESHRRSAGPARGPSAAR